MSNILSALKAIDPSEVSYQEWINVGMALQNEGYDCSVWDEWSRNDCRYHPGECERKWRTFHGAAVPITGATVVQMAKDRGRTPYGEDGVLDWNDSIKNECGLFQLYSSSPLICAYGASLSSKPEADIKPISLTGRPLIFRTCCTSCSISLADKAEV